MRVAPSCAGAETARTPVPAHLRPGLALLLQAYDYAQGLKRNVWDFAVEVQSLEASGLTNSDFRWLLCKGDVEHADEITLSGQDGRAFRRLGDLTLSKRTCFVLTETGASLARTACGKLPQLSTPATNDDPENGTVGAPAEVPQWDGDRQELRLGGFVVKQFKVPAPNQETILASFEEEGWPERIDDPLPPQPEQDAKRRLHDTINALNRHQKHELLHFAGDGSGQGVRWELISQQRRKGRTG